MHHIRSITLTAIALCAAAGAGSSSAQQVESRHLWATVNVCDTIKHPDTIGIRASMPGSPHKGERLYMRFRVQYYSRGDRLWHNITNGNSGFVDVGPARFKARQAGRLFVFRPPAGASFQLRGKVTFQWRRNGRVARSAALVTEAGHRSTAGSDPAGYSSDTCVIG